MSEISSISMQKMSNGAHFAYHTETVSYLTSDDKVKSKIAAALKVYADALAVEDETLKISPKSFLTDEIADADARRDAFYLGFKNALKAFASIPDPAMRQAQKALTQLLTDYRLDTRMQLDQETGLMMNLITDLEGKCKAEVEALSLNGLVAPMKAANEELMAAVSARDAERAVREAGAAKAARDAVDEAYSMVVKLINARALIEGEADYANVIARMNTLIVRYKRQVLRQKASAAGGGTSQPEEESPQPDGGDEAPDPTV